MPPTYRARHDSVKVSFSFPLCAPQSLHEVFHLYFLGEWDDPVLYEASVCSDGSQDNWSTLYIATTASALTFEKPFAPESGSVP